MVAPHPFHPSHLSQPRSSGPPIYLYYYVDASTSYGLGIIFDTRWKGWKLAEGWKTKFRHILWLEAVALELLVYLIEEAGHHDCHLTVHSDNQGVIGSYNKGRCTNFEANACIRRTTSVLSARNIAFKLNIVYVASAINPSDPISRGILGSDEDRLPSSLALPEELRPFLIDV